MTPFEIGPYNRSAIPPEAYYHLDEYGFVRLDWNVKPGDSLGGMSMFYYAYGDQELVFAAEQMWYFDSYGKYVGQRHPILPPEDHPMSRDHYHSTLWLLLQHYRQTGSIASKNKIKEITDNTGYIISKMARRGFGLKFWSEAIQGKKFYQFLWHWWDIFSAVFVYLPVHFTFGWIAEFSDEVEQWEYVPYPDGPRLQEQPKYKRWISKIEYPSYATQMTGWKIYALDGFPLLRKIHQAVYRPLIGKTNYVQHMLFGKKVDREKIELYQPMKGGRWSGWLNERNDRNMRVLVPSPEVNNLDVDVARKLWNETQL